VRPRKRILIIDSNEARRSELAYVLRVNGYATPESMERGGDLILAIEPSSEQQLQGLLAAETCYCQYISLNSQTNYNEVLDRVRIGAARKRGPRKGYKKAPQTSTPQPAANVA